MTRRLMSALLAAGLLPLAAVPAVTGPAAAGAPDRSGPAHRTAVQVEIVDSNSPFSPNGDGRKDRAVVRYRLSGTARVSIQVTRGGKTVFRSDPKAVRGGIRTATWAGTRTTGRRVSDGVYRLRVLATAHGRTRIDSVRVVLRATLPRLNAGTLELSSDKVYPYARLFEDVVVGNFSLTHPDRVVADPNASNAGERAVEASRAQILDRAGHVIAVEPLASVYARSLGVDYPADCSPCGRFTWDGRDVDGVRQPPGVYRIRVVQGRDNAGNTRILSGTRTVRISAGQLEQKTTTLDFTAAEAPRTVEPFTGCLGCDITTCGTVPSTRYAGGLSFSPSSISSSCRFSYAYFTAPVPGRRTPYDRFSVTARGGPSTPGSPDEATLHAGVPASPAGTATMTGDSTITTYAALTPNSEVYPDDWPNAVIWEVDSTAGSYDIASFRVSITTYVPAA